MRRPEPDSPAARQRASAAAEWLVKRDRGLTPAEQDEFLQWLADDARHGEWLAVQRRIVGNFDCLADWRPEHSEEPNPDLLARPRPHRRWLVPVSLAAAALAIALVSLQLSLPSDEAGPAVTHAYERRILEDGSTVELNRGAVVTVAFTAAERRVALVRGEALFHVAKNPARPFVVRAGGVDVRAVGTAFNVRLGTTAVEVLVTEGRVALTPPALGDEKSPGHTPAVTSELVAGQLATVPLAAATPPQIVVVSAEESERRLAWQPQLLDFSSVPLARAIAEFNRRNRIQFVLADAELAALPIAASIRSDNVEGFAQFLATAPNIEVERHGDSEIVLRRKK